MNGQLLVWRDTCTLASAIPVKVSDDFFESTFDSQYFCNDSRLAVFGPHLREYRHLFLRSVYPNDGDTSHPNRDRRHHLPTIQRLARGFDERVFVEPVLITFLAGSSFSILNPTSNTISPDSPQSIFGVNLVFTIGPYPDGQTTSDDTPLAAIFTPMAAGATVTFDVPTAGSLFPFPPRLTLNPSGYPALSGNGTFVLPISVTSTDITASQGEQRSTHIRPRFRPFPSPPLLGSLLAG